MDVFSLFAKIALDTSDYEKNLSDAGSKTSSFGDKLKSGLATAAKIGATAIAAVTTATTAMTAAMVKGVGDTAAYGDNIDKMSQKMGLSAQAYQEWDAIMQHSGTSIESLQAGMKTLANAVENGNGAFERLGITQEQIAGMNNEELFSATITALQNVENETERTYLAGQLLGRGATELGALLNTSAEDTEAMRQRVHELGGVMSDEAVKAAAAYQDSLQDMQTAFAGLGRGLTGELLPSFTTVMDGITEIFAGDSDKGIGMISSGIDGVLNTLDTVIPEFLEKGGGIVNALADGILKHLPSLLSTAGKLLTGLASGIISAAPTLVSAGLPVILSLISGLISALPEIFSTATEIVTTLALGIADALPELVPVAVEAILQLVETLTDPGTLSNLIDAAIAIIFALANGLIASLPILIEKAPLIVGNLVTALIENAPKMWDAAIGIIDELGNKLSEELPGLSVVFENLETVVAAVAAAFVAFKAATAISGVISALTNVTNLQTMAQAALNAVMNANPFVLVATLIAAVGTALVTLYMTNEDFRNKVQEVWGKIKEIFSEAWENIKSIWNEVKPYFTAAWEAIKVVWDNAVGYFENIWNTIKGIFAVVEAVLSGNFSDAWEAIKNVFLGWEEYFQGLWNTVTGIFSGVKEWFEDVGRNLLEGLWNGISDKVAWLKGKVTGVVDTIKSWFTGSSGFDEHSPSKWANQVFRYVMEGGGEGLEEGLPALMGNVSNVVDRVKSGMQFGTANVDFAASAVGQSSAAIINSASGGEGGAPVIPLTINLLTGESRPFAEWMLGDLIAVARERGTPITSGMQYA